MDRVETSVKVLARLAHLVGRSLFDFDHEGFEVIPRTGPVIIAANHFSHVDVVVVSAAAGRNVRYLGVDELFGRHRAFDRFMLFFGAIPISRDRPPLGGLRQAVVAIQEGAALGVFPEGKRVASWGDVTPPKRGAAWLAFATGAPLVPVAVLGSDATMSLNDRRLRTTPLRVAAGQPLWWHDYVDRVDPLAAMMADWEAWVGAQVGHWNDSDSA